MHARTVIVLECVPEPTASDEAGVTMAVPVAPEIATPLMFWTAGPVEVTKTYNVPLNSLERVTTADIACVGTPSPGTRALKERELDVRTNDGRFGDGGVGESPPPPPPPHALRHNRLAASNSGERSATLTILATAT
jgi:hypothetical protein